MPGYIEVDIGNITKRGADNKPVSFRREEFTQLIRRIKEDGAAETWIKPAGLFAVTGKRPEQIALDYGVELVSQDPKKGTARLRFPVDNFDFSFGGIPHLLGTIAGDILGYPEIATAKVERLELPSNVLSHFRGPGCGIHGVRKLLGGTDGRPLIAFTVKPRLGLRPEDYAAWCVEAAKGGADIVEDDERLVSPEYCRIDKRVEAVLSAFTKNKIRKTVYSVNITGNHWKTLEKAEQLRNKGIKMFKLDVLPAGFSTLQALSNQLKGQNVPITVYPGMGFLFNAISSSILRYLTRLSGGDIVYAGTPSLGGELGRHDVNWGGVHESVEKTKIVWNVLRGKLERIRPSMPTVSTNVHPGNIGLIYYIVKNEEFLEPNDFAFFVGGGIAFHPKGPKYGVEMCRCALDLAMNGKFRQGDFPAKHEEIFKNRILPFFSVDDYLKLKQNQN